MQNNGQGPPPLLFNQQQWPPYMNMNQGTLYYRHS